MAPRAGVVWIDVEPDLRGVGSKIEAGTRGIRPVGLKVDLDDRQLDRSTRRAQASVDGINTRRAQGEFQALGGTASQTLSDIEADLRNLQQGGGLSGGQLVAIGGAAAFAGTRVLGALRPATQAASDLNETLDFSRQVFGSGAAELERWAEGAARAIGASKREALDAATTFATYGKQIGLSGDELVEFSTRWTTAAADFASARNTTFEQASGAIASAFRGENDPIEGYSILLNEATLKQAALAEGIISTNTEALTPQQRILAASTEIWRQSADMQGNFARTADGLANSTKTAAAEAENAQAAFGSGLTDALAAAQSTATGLFEAIDKIPGGAEAAGFAIAGIGGAAILGGTVTSILGARRAIQDYRADVAEAAASTATVGPTGERSFGRLGGAVRAVGSVLAATAIVDSVLAIGSALQDLDGKAEDALNGVKAAFNAGSDDFTITARFDDAAEAEDKIRSIGDLIASVGTEVSFAGMTNSRDLEDYRKAWEKLKDSLGTEELNALLDSFERQNQLLPKTSNDYKETKKLIDQWRSSVQLAEGAQKKQTDATRIGGDALDQFGFKVDAAKTKAEQYADSLNQAFSPLQGALEAQSGLEDAQRRVADAEAEVARIRGGNTEGAREAAEAARELADAERSVEDAKRSQAAAYRDLADANRDLAGFEAELARVNPLTDPNRFRELTEKVNDARDAQLDAQDRVASAAGSVRDAEQQLADKRSESKDRADELADAEQELADARRAELEAALDADTANRKLREEWEKHPEAIAATFGVIDEWVAKGMIGAETARVWKEQLLLLIAAQGQVGFQPGGAPTGLPGAPGSNVYGPPAPSGGSPTPSSGRSTVTPPPSEVNSRWTPLGNGRWRDEVGKVWEWTGSGWRWVRPPGRRTGGPVQSRSLYRVVEDDRPELLTLGGDTYLMMGAQSGQVTPLGGDAVAAPALATISAPASTGSPAATAVLDTSAIVAELQALRADVSNLANVTYAPQITTVPGQVGPTMEEALRASRRDGWENHGRWLPNG